MVGGLVHQRLAGSGGVEEIGQVRTLRSVREPLDRADGAVRIVEREGAIRSLIPRKTSGVLMGGPFVAISRGAAPTVASKPNTSKPNIC